MKYHYFTYTGKKIDLFKIRQKDIDPIDIAHGLSNICRYNGQVEFYPVAQHSCLMYDVAPDHLKPQVLIHDAPEAYVGDVVLSLKHTAMFDAYRALEDNLLHLICRKFKIQYPLDPMVKFLDISIKEAEFRDLHPKVNRETDLNAASLFDTITPWTHGKAKKEFIKRLKKCGIEVK